MTPGGDDAGRPSEISRRRLLTGIGGIGAVGMASGLGTGAYLSDRETFRNNVFGAGEVGLTVDENPTNGIVTVGPFEVNRTTFDGRPDPETFKIEASANPVRVWLATDCPDDDRPDDDLLRNALEVEVAVDGESLTDGYRPLDEVERLLATGRRIDDGCLEAGPDGASIVVEIAPYLPPDAPDEVANSETDLTFRLYAEQCRHVSEADAAGSNPFADRVCEDWGDDCPECVEFGKADGIDGSLAVGDVVQLDGLPSGTAPHEIEITAVETKADDEAVGAAFVLRDADGAPGPNLCAVEIKGGNETVRYDLDPSSAETGGVLLAPLNPDSGNHSGISNIVVSVCSGDDDDDGSSSECVVCDDENVSLASLDIRYLGDDDASIIVVSTKGNTSGTLFDGTVAPDGVFTLFGSDVIRGGNGNSGNGNGNNAGADTTDKLGPEVDITVNAGNPMSLHVSCSELLAVGMRFGDGDLFEVTGGTTTDGQPICGTEEN